MDGVARGTLINLLTRLLGVGLMLAITAITARIGTDAQGRFALFTSVEGVLLALFSGFGIALARRVSHHGEDPRALVAATLVVCVGLGFATGLGLALAAVHGPDAYAALMFLAVAAPLMLIAPNLNGLWLGQGRMVPMALLALAPPALTLLFLAIGRVGGGPLSLVQVLVAWMLARTAVALGALGVVLRRGRVRPDFTALRAELPFVLTIGATNLVGLLNYRVGLFVVERLLGLSSTGVYSIAIVVAELLWFVSGSLTQAVYGRIGTPDRAQAVSTTLRVVHLGVAALLPVAPLLWLAAWLAVPRVLGPAYAASLPLLALLLPGVLLFGGASALSAYFTNHAGQPRVPAQVALSSLLLNGVLALALVPRLGMAGAALAASLSYSFSVALLAWRFARHAGLPLARVLVPGAQLLADLRGVAFRRGGHR
ncbi:MAG: polysaccharide biosynthesis C-terminal domain-containing protein [Rubrivivax sp.]